MTRLELGTRSRLASELLCCLGLACFNAISALLCKTSWEDSGSKASPMTDQGQNSRGSWLVGCFKGAGQAGGRGCDKGKVSVLHFACALRRLISSPSSGP